MGTPFVRRESADVVIVDASGRKYVAVNTGAGAFVVLFGAVLPWGFLSAGSSALIGVSSAWHLFLGGGVVIGGVAGLVSLFWGAHATGHLLRLEFSPPDKPEVVRLVRPRSSTRMPVNRLRLVRVVTAVEKPWGDDDPDPEKVVDVTVELHTADGVETAPPQYDTDPDVVVDRLRELLAAAGVPVETGTVVRRTRVRPVGSLMNTWWFDDRVAAEWSVPVDQVGDALHRLRVERLIAHHSYTNDGPPRSNPADVGRVTAAIADGSLARAVAGELLSEVNARGRPLAPRPVPRTGALAVFLPGDQAAAYRRAADDPDAARRVLAEAVLGGPAEPGEPLDETVRRALRRRPNLPYGRSRLPDL